MRVIITILRSLLLLMPCSIYGVNEQWCLVFFFFSFLSLSRWPNVWKPHSRSLGQIGFLFLLFTSTTTTSLFADAPAALPYLYSFCGNCCALAHTHSHKFSRQHGQGGQPTSTAATRRPPLHPQAQGYCHNPFQVQMCCTVRVSVCCAAKRRDSGVKIEKLATNGKSCLLSARRSLAHSLVRFGPGQQAAQVLLSGASCSKGAFQLIGYFVRTATLLHWYTATCALLELPPEWPTSQICWSVA